MTVKTPINAAKLRHHIQYNVWKYALLVIISIFLVDLVYTMTAYRPPEDKRIDVYIQSAGADQDAVDGIFEQMRADLLPDMELIRSYLLVAGGSDDVAAIQQLSTYIAAGEGDIYLLRGEDFKRYASQGAFVDLSGAIEQGLLHTDDIDLSSGYVAIQEYDDQTDTMVAVSQRRLYGIPLSQLPGFADEFGIYSDGLYMSMTVYNGNDENVIRFMDELLARTAVTGEQKDLIP